MLRILPKRELSSRVWRLAGPVVIGMVSQTLLNVVDTAMVGRLGAVALAAAGLGGVVSWGIIGSIGELYIGTQAISARRYGEKRKREAGKTLDNALLIALVAGVITSVLINYLVGRFFFVFSEDPAVVAQGRGYVTFRLLGALPYMIIMAHRGFFNGIGETQLHMRVAILINALNVGFNYVFIFGHFGAPAMGTAGAGLASALGTFCGMVFFLVISMVYRGRNDYGYYATANIQRSILGRLLQLSGLSAMRVFLAMMGFSAFSAIVARLGTVEMAATNVVLTIISMSFLPGAGFGIASASLIGQKLGEGDPDGAEEYGWEAVRLGVLVMGAFGLAFLLFPELLMRFFTQDPRVIEAGKLALRLMGVVQVFDAVGMVLGGSLEGAGMNRFVMLAEISVNWLVFLPATYLFAFVFGWGLTGAWSALGIYILLVGGMYVRKFAGGSWKTVEV